MVHIDDFEVSYIENIIEQGIKANKGEITKYENGVRNLYFCGATLFVDINTPTNDNIAVVCISYNRETYNLFIDGKYKRVLSLKAMKSLKVLMDLCGVKHDTKEHIFV